MSAMRCELCQRKLRSGETVHLASGEQGLGGVVCADCYTGIR